MTQLVSQMKGVVLTGHGGLDKLELRFNLDLPEPKQHEVLIRVKAAGINNTDINTRTGWYSKSDNGENDASWSGNALAFPRIQGADVCGEIVKVGRSVEARRVGERVLIEPCITDVNGVEVNPPWYFGSECNGGFAEYVTVSSVHAYKVTSQFSDIELASFPCSYSTAENMLTRAKVTKSDRVLITGASGGVGSAAIQLAKARGAKVVALTSPNKTEQIQMLGADEVVSRDLSLLDTIGKNSVDVVIDLVAGNLFTDLLQVLKPKGRYSVSGAIGGAMVALDVRTLYLKDLSFFGCTVLEKGVFSNLVSLIEQGDIKPLIAKSFPLEDIKEAQKEFEEKNHVGKLVLNIS
ncbi:alcohol dehydrogenase family protein [Psychrosphaera haliotis]|uniref:Zinc-binding dehydrogenase n=1 Tax=Psychrosphaera haliotis TaxID=555083 RepID=A0A6N8FD64_9GAMM|nr:alcohol dehydrogenase family protein [Psychrosphaera haliotis]MUH72261.1 zinc-binding dehydrogenase [Psychrosphaera haliotis]